MKDYKQSCCYCNRPVDRREESEGGDPYGAQLPDKTWTCSMGCYDIMTGHLSVENITKALRNLDSDEERDGVFDNFCIYCGSNDNTCECWRDE